MDSFKEAVKTVKQAFGGKQDRIEWQPATLGDGKGHVIVDSNTVYCRLSSNSSVIEVLNYRVAPIDGLRVRIAKTPEMPLHWQVIGQDDQRVDEISNSGGGINYSIPNHHLLHEYLGVDQINVDWRQIRTLRVYASSGFTIGVIAGLLPRVGADLVVPSQTLDLSAHLPVAGALYVLISIDTTGALVATDGTLVGDVLTLTLGDIPDTPSGNFRLAAIRLYAGQSAINESTVSNDIRDLRWPQERLASSLIPSDIAAGTHQYQYIVTGPSATFTPAWSSGYLNITSAKTLTVNNSLTLAGTDSTTLTLTTALTNQGAAGVLNWGGAYTLTVPMSGTAALLGVDPQTFTGANTFQKPITIGTASIVGSITFPSTSTGHGPHFIDRGVGTFNGTEDPFLFLSYNLGYSGNQIVAGEAGIAIGIEGDYNDATRHMVESYLHVVPNAGGTYYRLYNFGADRTNPRDWMAAQFTISGTAGKFNVIRGSDGAELLALTSAGGSALTIAGQVSIGAALDVKNSSNVSYWATGESSARFTTGISGAGGFQFQSLDAVTPRTFAIVGAGVGSKFTIEFQTGNTIIYGTQETAGNAYFDANVGVGTLAPRQKFQVNGGTIGEYNGSAVGSKAHIFMGSTDFDSAGFYNKAPSISSVKETVNADSGLALHIYTAGNQAEAVRVSYTKSVMIGTTTDGMTAGGSLAIAQDLAHRGTKVGFNNATPIAKYSATGDLRQALIDFGLYTTGGASPLDLNGGALSCANITTSTGVINSLIYGSMYADDITQAVTVAASNTYYKVPGSMTVGNCNGFTLASSRELTCSVAGKYLVTWGMSITSATNNENISGAAMINTTEVHQSEGSAQCINSSKPIHVSGSAVVALGVNDVLALCVQNEDAAHDITVYHANLTAVRIGA